MHSHPASSTRRRRGALPAILVGLLMGNLVGVGVSPVTAAALRATTPDAGGAATADSAAVEAGLKGDLSMDEAIDRAQKRYRARVVRAEQVEQGGRIVYVLRLLSDEDGRVFTVRVDARSGAMQ